MAQPQLVTQRLQKCMKKDRDEGKCCCTCVHQKGLRSHPSVNGYPVTHIMGYVCAAPEDRDDVKKDGPTVMANQRHGLCEMWEAK